MYAFNYHRAETLDQAQDLLAHYDDPKILAGGHTLLPTMKQRLANPSDLVDIAAISALKDIQHVGSMLSIGALETHAHVATSPIVQQAIPGLAALAGQIGDPHVRNRGTLGGSIANNDPAADYPAACLALSALIHTTRRHIKAQDFFIDLFETALEEHEIITRVEFPVPETSAYAKFPNPASRYALVGVYVAKTRNGVDVAVTGAGPVVFLATDLAEALTRSFMPGALDGVSINPEQLNDDLHASAAYRAHLIGIMTRQAVTTALARV